MSPADLTRPPPMSDDDAFITPRPPILKAVTIAMGVLIMIGTTVVIATIVNRLTSGQSRNLDKAFAAVLEEPPGSGIVGVSAVRDRLVVQLHGGGADRVVLIDPATGEVVGRVSLPR